MTNGETVIDDVVSLALNIYFEARGENKVGQMAVGFVTLNRVKDSRWPNTIHEVVWQDSKPEVPGGEQFSWTALYSDEFDAVEKVRDTAAFYEAIAIAADLLDPMKVALVGRDFTQGANLYHAHYVSPWWNKSSNVERTALIGNHIFYREE